MKTTLIQWADSTVNPTMGCEGCELWTSTNKSCYAGTLHLRHASTNRGYAPRFEEPTLFPGRLEGACRWTDLTGHVRPSKPWLNGAPRLIFVSDMGDALSQRVSFEYLATEIVMNVRTLEGQRHRWLWLTKRPERMRQFSAWLESAGVAWPTNLWAGTSVTRQSNARARIEALLEVGDESTSRFLSVEPQLEPISIGSWLVLLDWVIQGGESGPDAAPFNLDWARRLKSECHEAGTSYFLKQGGAKVVDGDVAFRMKDHHGGDWAEWPPELRVRELPDFT